MVSEGCQNKAVIVRANPYALFSTVKLYCNEQLHLYYFMEDKVLRLIEQEYGVENAK